jgi:hypothetical protein
MYVSVAGSTDSLLYPGCLLKACVFA